MADNAPLVSVVIPTFRDWDRLHVCLSALTEQTLSCRTFEVVVANNDPDDFPPAKINQEWPFKFTIVNVAQKGSYAARNSAAAVAQSERLAFTDADCIPETDWLEIVVNSISGSSSTLLLSGDVKMFSEVNQQDALNLAESYDYFFGICQKEYAQRSVACTANLSMHRNVFSLAGGFNPKLFSGGDVDFCSRAIAAGAEFQFAANCIVRHPLRHSFSALAIKSRRVIGARIAKQGYIASIGTLMPPLYRIFKIMRMEHADLPLKLKAILGTCAIKCVQVSEYIMLLLKLKDMENR